MTDHANKHDLVYPPILELGLRNCHVSMVPIPKLGAQHNAVVLEALKKQSPSASSGERLINCSTVTRGSTLQRVHKET